MTQVAPAPIGVVVFGVSTPFAYWGFGLVRDLVGAATGATLHLHLSTLPELHDGFARRGGASVVVTSDLPDVDLMNFLTASPLPLIVFGDDAEVAIAWTAHSRNLSADDAVRLCSMVASAVAPAFCAPRALRIKPGAPASTVVAKIVAHLFETADAASSESLLQTLVETGKRSGDGPPDWRQEGAPPPPPDPERAAQRMAALASYETLGGERCELVWPVALFTRRDSDNWREPIDLTGPARVVLYGPYLHLPVGAWIARVEFEIDKAISGVEAATDVFVSDVLVEKVFVMPRQGIFAYELAFAVSDPRVPVEIRLFTKRSAIEGLLLVRSVTVRPGAAA